MGIPHNRASLAELVLGENNTAQVEIAIGQERFARELAAGHNYETAYARAYGLNTERNNCAAEAMRLARLPHIVARVMQLRAHRLLHFLGREMNPRDYLL